MRYEITKYIILLIAFAIGLARFQIASTPVTAAGSYQAFAHLFVGGVFGAAIALRNKYYMAIGVGLSLLELFCFITR